MLPKRIDLPDYSLQIASQNHIEAVSQIFKSNLELLQSTGLTLSPRVLAEDAIYNQTLPPSGDQNKASTYIVHSKRHEHIIGLVELYMGYPTATTLWIAKLFLHTKEQGKGCGRKIIATIENYLKPHNFIESRVAINVPNWGALWFWSKAGYTKICGTHGPSTPPTGMLILSKKL